MYIVMLGAPGSGKGTCAKILAKKTGLPHISTGDMFREQIKKETELGKLANSYISKGQLVPDEVTIGIVKDRLTWDDAQNGVILDGFPRTIEQAKKLDEILAKEGKRVDLVINLTTPKEEIIDRMLTRRVCPNCKATFNTKLHPPKVEGVCDGCGGQLVQRDDDSNPDAIRRRLEIYEEKTSPLVDYYTEQGVLKTEEMSVTINRMGAEVAKDMVEYINNNK